MKKNLIAFFAIFWIFSANEFSHYAWGQSDTLNSHDILIAIEKEKEAPKILRVSFWPDSPSAGGFTGTLEVENKSTNDVKDITFICDHYAPSGTVLGQTKNTIYRVIRAKKTEKIKNFDLGYVDSQVVFAFCSAINFK